MMEIAASQPGVLEGYTPDPELTEVVKRLPEYLQHVVTLTATMVPPIEESKIREKRGLEALAQVTNMVLMMSAFFHLHLHQVRTGRTPNNALLFSSLFFLKRSGSGLGARAL